MNVDGGLPEKVTADVSAGRELPCNHTSVEAGTVLAKSARK